MKGVFFSHRLKMVERKKQCPRRWREEETKEEHHAPENMLGAISEFEARERGDSPALGSKEGVAAALFL